MSSELLSRTQKREAIGRGLSPYMNENSLQRVLNYWEDEYGDQPPFVLNKFLTEICNTDELRFFKKDILKKVLGELATLEKDILLNPSKTPKVNDFILSKQTYQAFIHFVQEVCNTVDFKNFSEFNDDVKIALKESKFELLTNSNINDKVFLDFIPTESYARFITTLYEVYCEYFGPPKADQVYAQLKLKVKQTYPQVDIHVLL